MSACSDGPANGKDESCGYHSETADASGVRVADRVGRLFGAMHRSFWENTTGDS